ncbi:MAG: S1C family serine protease [Caldicoprobacterales bacterium]|nr:trypsin-like serine protease [Clostridiales bacterium]
MKEFYEFDEERYQRKSRIKSYILVALIFTLIGGLVMYSISPYVFGQKAADNQPAVRENDNFADGRGAVEKEEEAKNTVIGSTEDLYINRDNPVADIAEKVEKAVVGITNRSEMVVQDFFFFNRSTVRPVEGYGSGIIISKEGHILTNHHVIEGAKELFVILSNGEKIEAKLIGSDPQSDIAVVKVDYDDLTVAKIGDSDKVRKGDFVIAIGNPLGHELAGTVNFGVISAANRKLQLPEKTMELIQTDAAINQGNSGGALVNMNGEVIGMNTIKFGGGTIEGLGFAIPSNIFKPIAEEIIKTGKVTYPQKPWLGIVITEITEAMSREYGYPVGVLITDVQSDSPAAESGLKPGDVIIGLNGQKIKTIKELRGILDNSEVGGIVDMELWREENEFVLKVKLGGIDVYD